MNIGNELFGVTTSSSWLNLANNLLPSQIALVLGICRIFWRYRLNIRRYYDYQGKIALVSWY